MTVSELIKKLQVCEYQDAQIWIMDDVMDSWEEFVVTEGQYIHGDGVKRLTYHIEVL